jgi:hypothetical protein
MGGQGRVSHLQKYLEDHAVLYPEQLQEAIRRQEIYGGSLDTALLELGLIDPVTLNELLSQACGIPVAPIDLIDNGHDRPWDALPAPMMAVGWAQPLVRRGDDILVAVHPDLPDEQLGALYRKVPGVKVHVSPECCLQKVSAERLGAVMPQRYAVACVQYLSAVKRRPSLSGVYDIPEEVEAAPTGPIAERAATLPPMRDNPVPSSRRAEREAAEAAPPPTNDATIPPYGEPLATEQETVADAHALPEDTGLHAYPVDAPPDREDDGPTSIFPAIQDAGDSGIAGLEPVEGVGALDLGHSAFADDGEEHTGIPHAVAPDTAASLGARRTRSGTQIYDTPPVRYTGRGTMIGEPVVYEQLFDEADLLRRIATARTVLDEARTRDDAIEALVAATMVIAKRTALFRARPGELVGLETPRSELHQVGGKVVPLHPGSPMAEVVEVGRWSGTTGHPDLMLAVGNSRPVPAVLRRIDVRGRPVLVVYADHGGREFLPAESNQLDALCAAASDSFEAILRLRAGDRKAPPPPPPIPTSPPPSASLDTGEHLDWGPPSDRLRAAYGASQPPASPETSTANEDTDVRARLEVELELPPRPSPLADDDRPAPRRDTEEFARGLDRVARPDDPTPPPPPHPTEEDEEELSNLKLTWVGAPPPPPLPPPPPAAHDDFDDLRPRMPTLHGLPPLEPGEIEDSASEIISLSTPLAQSSMRGRIALEAEDYVRQDEPGDNPSLASHVDTIVDAIARGEDRIAELRDIGEVGWTGLAARFPGPIEVLRRDLRALPPPAAHGPLLRAAINAGRDIVPYLLALSDHANPDVRFYAAFVFQELRDARCTPSLATLAFDPNGDVRVIAMRVLETYSRTTAFSEAAALVRARLETGTRAEHLYAARAVGTLRDVEAIPRLIELLSNKDRFIQEAALESLCSITGQQHGLKPHRWKSWYEEHSENHRVEWIIDSLRHRDLPVRRWAADELIRVTGHRIPFSPMGDRRARDIAAQAWIDWWNERGQRMLTAERTEPNDAPAGA